MGLRIDQLGLASIAFLGRVRRPRRHLVWIDSHCSLSISSSKTPSSFRAGFARRSATYSVFVGDL